MTPPAKLACLLTALAAAQLAQAQAPAPADAAAAYQDRVIDGGALKPDISNGDLDAGDGQGLARSLQIDAIVSDLSSHGAGPSTNAFESGFVAKYQWDTLNYGAWSLDGSARVGSSNLGPSEQGQGGALTLRERGLSFDGGWQADNALGDVNSPDIGLARVQARFFLPTATLQGATTEWRGPDGIELVAGGGKPGIYDGIEIPDFKSLSGSTATFGAEWSPAAHWTVGGQIIEAHDVNLAIGPVVDGSSLMSSTATLLSAAWADQGDRLQFNLLDDDVSGSGNGIGAWMDGTMTSGHVQQTAGLFRIDPDMTWGNQVISNDMEGGYYRFDYQDRRWILDGGVDEVHSVSGLGSDVTFLTGDARYQLSHDWGVGGAANISRSDGSNAWSLQGYVDHLDAWGSARAQVDYADASSGIDRMLTLEQTWNMPVGTHLSTALTVEHIGDTVQEGFEQDSTVLGINLFGGGEITANLGGEANVRWAKAVSGEAAPGISANVSLIYQLTRNWQVLATYYDSRTSAYTPLTVVSPLTPPVATMVPAQEERGVFLTLRYKRASGMHFAPLGGAAGGAAGELAGTVYLDANNNGQLDAGEIGAANVTVVLDGRFSVQTDANGRFDFAAVASGHHVLSVVADNLPLPWALVGDGRVEVTVGTRDRTDVAIGAQRPR
jgi:SdrD B-like domain